MNNRTCEHDGGLESAEAAAYREHRVHLVGACGAWHVVEVAFGVGVLEVGGRRDRAVANRQHARGELDGTDGTERVSDHRLDRTHGCAVRVLSQAALHRRRLVAVVLHRAGAVRVDVADRRGVQSCLPQRIVDGLGHLDAVRPQPGHVECVAPIRESTNLGQDGGIAAAGVLVLLENQHGRAFAHDESVARCVERARRVLGVVVAGRGRPDRVEAGDGDPGDRSVTGAGDDDIGIAVLDELVAVADGVEPRRAAGRDDRGRTVGAEPARDLAGEAAGCHRVVEESARVPLVDLPVLSVVADNAVLVFEPRRGADRAAHADRHPVVVDVLQAAVRHCLGGRHQGELGEPVVAVDFLLGEAGGHRVEVALGPDLGAETGGIEQADPARGGTPGGQQPPEVLPGAAAGRDDPDPGHHRAPAWDRHRTVGSRVDVSQVRRRRERAEVEDEERRSRCRSA